MQPIDDNLIDEARKEYLNAKFPGDLGALVEPSMVDGLDSPKSDVSTRRHSGNLMVITGTVAAMAASLLIIVGINWTTPIGDDAPVNAVAKLNDTHQPPLPSHATRRSPLDLNGAVSLVTLPRNSNRPSLRSVQPSKQISPFKDFTAITLSTPNLESKRQKPKSFRRMSGVRLADLFGTNSKSIASLNYKKMSESRKRLRAIETRIESLRPNSFKTKRRS